MGDWLSEEWVRAVAASAGSRPPIPGATGTVSLAIAGGPAGEAAYRWSYRDGVPGDGAAGAAGDADLALAIGYADARLVATGEIEPSVAFMRGRLKATGDGALLLGLLASTATDAYRAWRQEAVGLADHGLADS